MTAAWLEFFAPATRPFVFMLAVYSFFASRRPYARQLIVPLPVEPLKRLRPCPAFLRRSLISALSPSRAVFFAAAGHGVHRCPGTTTGFLFGHAAILVTFLNVLSLTFLLVGILAFVSPWHWLPPLVVFLLDAFFAGLKGAWQKKCRS
jgi:hypothetical protein